eukprot:jgi/Orpsp1_1/1180165/evm.model.c7180000072368.1
MSKPFDQDLSKSTIITSLSDTLFHNGMASISLVVVLLHKNKTTVFWKYSLCVVIIVFIRSMIMLASELYWWFMLKKTLKDHTEDDFIIPEEELNTQYHQISYDYHNPKRIFNQSNVVILNKKQKKKIDKLQKQQEKEDQILQEIEREFGSSTSAGPSSNKNSREKQNKNKAMFDEYMKERMANDNEANYHYIRKQNKVYLGSNSSVNNLLNKKHKNEDSDTDSNDDSESESDDDNNNYNNFHNLHSIHNNNNNDDSNSSDEEENIYNYNNKNKTKNSSSEPLVVEMFGSNHNRKYSVESSSSSSSSLSENPQNSNHTFHHKKNLSNTKNFNNNNYNNNNNNNNNNNINVGNSIFIDMQNSNNKNKNNAMNTFDVNTIDLDDQNSNNLTTQKTKVLEYMDKLIAENKEKKRLKQQAQRENPEKWNRNHPREWFSEVMGVKEIQEEKDAKLFVKAKQKKEKEIIEQKMENLKEELNHANTPEQVESIFKELKALNGIW